MHPISSNRKLIFIPALLIAAGTSPMTAQTISTFAGNGVATFAGDSLAATGASLNQPKGIAAAPNGTVYVADQLNFRVRAIAPKTGVISTLAGNGTNAFSGDGGLATAASLSKVLSVAVDQSGNVYVSDGSNNRRIRKISTSGIISTIAGNGTEGSSGDGGLAINAQVGVPTALTFDGAGNLYFTDATPSCQCVRKIDTSGVITRVAGTGVAGYSGDFAPALQASMDFPLGIAVDGAGNIYVADTNNNAVRKISHGTMFPVAGNGGAGFSGDGGLATQAKLNLPSDVAVDVFGNIYIADSGNNRVRKIDANGIISTIAGTGDSAFSGDNGAPTLAAMNHPWGVATDANGTLYVADGFNNRVRVIPSSNVGPPSLSAGSAVNAASFVAGQAVAPGSYVAIFGSAFSAATILAQSTPLPNYLGNTSVTVNGVNAPLYFVSPGQINIQVPFTTANGAANIVVNRGSTSSATQLMGVATYSPGIFMVGGSSTQGVVVHAADFSLVTPFNPAKRGENIALYATGLGPLTVTQQAGVPAPSAEPLPRTTVNPTVTLGSQVMSLQYSGLAPTLIGVYQLNFQVPTNMTPGNQNLTLSVGGVTSNTAVVPVQ